METKMEQYLNFQGSVISDGGIFTLSDMALLNLWTGFSMDQDENDYWKICDLMDQTVYEEPFKYKSILGADFVIFYTMMKQYFIFQGNDVLALMELEYSEVEPDFSEELEFKIVSEPCLKLPITSNQLTLFDAALDRNDFISYSPGIFRSKSNRHFEDIVVADISCSEILINRGSYKSDGYSLEGFIVTKSK